jgi:hypothetical protein
MQRLFNALIKLIIVLTDCSAFKSSPAGEPLTFKKNELCQDQ